MYDFNWNVYPSERILFRRCVHYFYAYMCDVSCHFIKTIKFIAISVNNLYLMDMDALYVHVCIFQVSTCMSLKMSEKGGGGP